MKTETLDLTTFNFPKLSGVEIAFSTLQTDKMLLAEAKNRGFYGGNTEYNKLFAELFFKGGKLNFKKDIDEEFKKKALPYLKAFMGSFEPRQEEKEAICAMLLSELVNA